MFLILLLANAKTVGTEKAQTLPYSDTGLAQPLYTYGEDCARAHSSNSI